VEEARQYSAVTQSVGFIVVGVLVYWLADRLTRFISDRADRWERQGVIRYGGFGLKVWRENDPQKFGSRIDHERFAAAAARGFMKIFGAIFAIGGIAQLIGSLFR
jgi:hypothetical protein